MYWATACAIALATRGAMAEMGCAKEEAKPAAGYNGQLDILTELLEQHKLVESPVVVAHPKITEPPSLMRRKLGSTKWDMIHEGIQGRKREAASCPTDFQLCPASLEGGCCPNDRECGTSSCYSPSTTAIVSACGVAGYVACDLDDGGGCCPSNYICGKAGCTAPVGISYSQTCGVNSYLCPASLGYGCCKNGMGCGVNNCYSTDIVTYTMTEVITTTQNGNLQTLTSTIVTATTPVPPTAIVTSASGAVPKVNSPTETAIPKTSSISTPSLSSGLSKVQIGGIIGGAIILLLVLLVLAFIIIRRLKKVDRALEQEKSRASSAGPGSRPPGQFRSRHTATTDFDTMSIDPLIMGSSETTQSIRSLRHGSTQSQVSAIHSSHHEVEASSPPIFSSPFPPKLPPYGSTSTGGYAAVASSDSSSSGRRHYSLESAGHTASPAAGYFDIPPNKTDLRDQNLRFGHSPPTVSPPARRPSKHDRQWSQSSEVSQGSVELDAGPDGDRRSSLQRALQGIGTRLSLKKKRKGSAASVGTGQPVLTGGPQPWVSMMSPAGLGYITEAGESRVDLEGSTEEEEEEDISELGNGTLKPGARDRIIREKERREAYRNLHDTPHDMSDVDLRP